MIVDVLGRIAKQVQQAVEEGYYRDFARANAPEATPPSLRAAIRRDAPSAFLAEVKPASPSGGRPADGPARARAVLDVYRRYGVTGISVLTERDTFRGSLELLAEACAPRPGETPTPVLMKDFVLDASQLDAARAAGASAVLVIHRLLARPDVPWSVAEAIAAAHARGLEVVLEVDDAPAFDDALATDAAVLGINNRDLKTLEMDPDRAIDILRHRGLFLEDRPALALSGIGNRADVLANRQGGATGVLVGTSLMTAPDVRGKLRALRGLAHAKCCGAGHAEDGPVVREALAGADAVGALVGVPNAVRERTAEEARSFFASMPSDVERVVVTIAAPDAVRDIVTTTGATHVQWHRDATPAELEALRATLPAATGVVAVLRLPAAQPGAPPADRAAVQEHAATARRLLAHADRLLLDTRPPDGRPAGGTGLRLDWDLAARLVTALRPAPVVLAGGLDPDNVAAALRKVRPWGVDLSSGIEGDEKGRKDPRRVRAFLAAVRAMRDLDEPPEEVKRLRVL